LARQLGFVRRANKFIMRTNSIIAIILVLSAFIFTSCEIIGGIFNAGVYTGIFIVVFFIALIIFAVVRMGKRD
jgi:hypothetical protein